LHIFAKGLRDVIKTVHAYAGKKPLNQRAAQNMIRFAPELVAYRLSRALLNPHSNIVYIDRPQILTIWHRTFFENDKLRRSYELDIVSHGVESFEENPERYFEAFFMQGVADTLVEGAVFRNQHVVNAAAQFLKDKKSGRQWGVISAQNKLPKGIAPHTQKLIESALGEGLVIVAPEVVQDANRYVWWQINPHTGETLGYGPRGTGTATVNYYINLINVVLCAASSISAGYEAGTVLTGGVLAMPFCIIGAGYGMLTGRLAAAAGVGSLTAAQVGSIVSIFGTIIPLVTP
jgi:hypothetical protein